MLSGVDRTANGKVETRRYYFHGDGTLSATPPGGGHASFIELVVRD